MDNKYKKIRSRLSKKRGLATYNNEELKYLRKILGKAAYSGKPGRPATRKKRDGSREQSDMIKCKICNKEYRRSCKWNHERTKHHRNLNKFHNKMYKILIDGDKDN